MFDNFHRNQFLTAPGTHIGNHRQTGVAKLQFACQRRLGHTGHADQITTVPFQFIDLGRGLQAWPLCGGITTFADQRHAHLAGPIDQYLTQFTTIGLGKVDMGNMAEPFLKEGIGARPGIIDDLIRHDQPARLHVGADPADGIDRNHLLHPALLQGP